MKEVDKICDSMWDKLSPYTNQHKTISDLKAMIEALIKSKCREMREEISERCLNTRNGHHIEGRRYYSGIAKTTPLPKI